LKLIIITESYLVFSFYFNITCIITHSTQQKYNPMTSTTRNIKHFLFLKHNSKLVVTKPKKRIESIWILLHFENTLKSKDLIRFGYNYQFQYLRSPLRSFNIFLLALFRVRLLVDSPFRWCEGHRILSPLRKHFLYMYSS
jgi:hypothetical protein